MGPEQVRYPAPMAVASWRVLGRSDHHRSGRGLREGGPADLQEGSDTMVGFSTSYADGSAELRLMHRDQLIDRIRTRNPGATLEFLNRFRDEALRLYLRHLACADEPRGSVWVRPGDTVGIVGRESAE